VGSREEATNPISSFKIQGPNKVEIIV